MRVPLSWLRDHCPASAPAADLAETLTMHGLPVERILHPWEGLSGVVVARVLEVSDHPKADRLCRAVVEDGRGQHEVVVGVRNMGPGDLVPYAPPGARVPALDAPLERREIRGVTSEGMLASPKELGISGDHGGILVLPTDLEPGVDLAEALGLDEPVLDLEILANRADLLSIVGVAREVSAITGEELRLPETTASESIERAASAATVEVEDSDGCPRYLARVIREVTLGPSPLAVQVRLAAAGVRPVSNVVDATNYAMVELGQPLHPFDLHRLAGRGIVVRRARADERLVTLDGIERRLDPEDLLICDVERPVGIAGVMGGSNTEVSEETADVLLEAAWFSPTSIFRTSRRLGLRTEASVRFERGVDPEGVAPAAARAAALIAEWSGGRVLSGSIDVGEPPPRRSVTVRAQRTSLLLGVPVSPVEVRQALGRLRVPATEEGDIVTAEVPPFRVDLEREVDLVEEVGRITGYDRVPSALPGIRQAGGAEPPTRIRERVRDLLAGAGLYEAISNSFGPAGDAELGAEDRTPVRIANPISSDEAFLRTSLLPGLLRAARRNVSHRRVSVRLFDVGTVFAAGDPSPDEGERVAALVTGPVTEGWSADRRMQDFLDAKGILEHLLDGLGVVEWSLAEGLGKPWHPGRSAAVLIDGEVLGQVGELHPRVGESLDLPGRVAAFELRMPLVADAAGAEAAYRDVSRFPPLRRDVAFVLDGGVPAGDVRAALVDAGGPLLDRVVLFDVFEGEPIPAGKRSLAFALDFRAPDRTLTDDEADQLVGAIADRLRRDLGAELRAG
ncbi:MAG TPA: phenylalanine--tRNA ligase subunit beta [Actinomycetota bacterium]|nr:phenylalanine--tRNA ligase subunit beta [Actinomycetota bacterium]